MSIKNKLKKVIKQCLYKAGTKTDRHIIVFESDDWGAVRNFSKENLEKFKNKYPDYEMDAYKAFDCLETDEDIKALENVLMKHKDCKNRYSKFTLNFATSNPNFEEIKKANYSSICLERIDETYKKTTSSNRVLQLVNNGIDKGVFKAQLHSREHINSNFLLNDLQTNSMVKDAFDLEIVGIVLERYCAMDTLNNASKENNKQLLVEAMQSFESLFGYKSKTFIAPCYVWNKNDESILKNLGVEALQGKLFQNEPKGRDEYKSVYHKFGSKGKAGLSYMTRNCFFEPSKSRLQGLSDEQIVNNILKEIEFAFSCKKPATICTHRVNYVGGIDLNIRNLNLNLLDILLTKLKKKYPDIEFMSSDEVYEEIINDRNNKT